MCVVMEVLLCLCYYRIDRPSTPQIEVWIISVFPILAYNSLTTLTIRKHPFSQYVKQSNENLYPWIQSYGKIVWWIVFITMSKTTDSTFKVKQHSFRVTDFCKTFCSSCCSSRHLEQKQVSDYLGSAGFVTWCPVYL